MKNKDVVIVGAGPYGLSSAAWLRHSGMRPCVVGKPMSFWKENMPVGMRLRSGIEASSISHPGRENTMEVYARQQGRSIDEPVPIADFIAYATWFEKQAVPDIDSRPVKRISRNGVGFSIAFEDGQTLTCQAVVLALGIGHFDRRPEQFAGVPPHLALHSSAFSDPSRFNGQRVAVIGRGQSGLEYAALLREAGADVRIVTRSPEVKYLPPRWRIKVFRALTPGPLRPISHKIRPPTDLGDFRSARIMDNPKKFRRQTPEMQEKLLNSCQKPIGSHWLRPRLDGVPIHANVGVRSVEVLGDALKLSMTDSSDVVVDRVILATGYKIDVSRYRLLAHELMELVETRDGYPVLTMNLETTVKGLYMTGVVGERTLGPTLRFVTGTSNASPHLTAGLAV